METSNIIWSVVQLERNKEDDMVYTVHYRADIVDCNCNVGSYGSIGLSPADPKNKIPFEELTEELVIEWVKSTLGKERVDELENSLISQIEYKKNPPSLTGTPW